MILNINHGRYLQLELASISIINFYAGKKQAKSDNYAMDYGHKMWLETLIFHACDSIT